MDKVATLRQYGLFDAKVPRYTSYPPANRFMAGVGTVYQIPWLDAVPKGKPISLYIHIPFCRRLCWFCACRTQGTKTLGPVETYVNVLLQEIDAVAEHLSANGQPMLRLHLGGGTPTLLSADLMTRLLTRIYERFSPSDGFEFSVEIDPTEAAEDVLRVLAAFNMTRASIGVQDFDPSVQEAIGRVQGFDVTQRVVDTLRTYGVRSLNIDFLYGLPFQTQESLTTTLDHVVSLQPDRLALYGYAHVPHVSKRQVMIPDRALPGAEQRFALSQLAHNRLKLFGYVPLGIDHFALPHDSLTVAASARRMTRNFQGYTDDPCDTLIGLGASAISHFPQGYLQNAVATSAYHSRVETGGLAACKGIALTDEDRFIRRVINGLMCDGAVRRQAIAAGQGSDVETIIDDVRSHFLDAVLVTEKELRLRPGYMPMARLIAAHLDRTHRQADTHSLAV